MAKALTEYRYMGTHGAEVIVGDKVVPVGMGDFVKLSEDDLEDTHNAGLLDDGLLVDPTSLAEDAPVKAEKTTTDKTEGGDK